jgi:hypothetical protein
VADLCDSLPRMQERDGLRFAPEDACSSSAAVVWVTALTALALARSSQARPGHSLFVRGDCPLGEARHAELVGGGARLLEEPAALW